MMQIIMQAMSIVHRHSDISELGRLPLASFLWPLYVRLSLPAKDSNGSMSRGASRRGFCDNYRSAQVASVFNLDPRKLKLDALLLPPDGQPASNNRLDGLLSLSEPQSRLQQWTVQRTARYVKGLISGARVFFWVSPLDSRPTHSRRGCGL